MDEGAAPAGAVSAGDLIERARALVPVLRDRQAEVAGLRRIPDEIVDRLRAADLYRVLLPRRFGGFELGWDDFFRIAAAVGSGCGSTGWVYSTGMQHSWSIGLFAPEAQDDVWGPDPGVLAASSFAPTGLAVPVEGGFRLSGRWMFCSGIDNSRWSILGGRIADGPAAAPRDVGLFLVPAADYEVEDNWHVVGLEGTGSKNARVDDRFVPGHRFLSFAEANSGAPPGAAANDGALFRVPFFAAVSICLSAPAIGAAIGALEDYRETIGVRRTRGAALSGSSPMSGYQSIQLRVAEAAANVDAATLLVERDCREIMEAARAGQIQDEALRARNKGNLSYAVRLSARAVDLLFDTVGGQGLFLENRLQRAWRDIHAAAKHISLAWDATGAVYGRTLLGLPAGSQQI